MQSTLAESIRSLERRRKSLLLTAALGGIAASAALGLIALSVPSIFWQLLGASAGRPPAYALWPSVFALGICAAYFSSLWGVTKYRWAFKNEVVHRLIKTVDASIAYEPALGINQADFQRSGLFFRQPNWYHTEDQIRGTVHGALFTAAEVNAEYRSHDSKGDKVSDTIFSGLFVKIELPSALSERVVIVSDDAEFLSRTAAKVLQSFDITKPGRVVRFEEDSAFEDVYAVYAASEDEARGLLTPAFRRQLTDLRERSFDEIRIAFSTNEIYVAVTNDDVVLSLPHTTELTKFEPSLWRSLTDANRLETHAEHVRLVLKLVRTLVERG